MSYAARSGPHRSFMRDEWRALLRVSMPAYRDHMLFSMALGTGLREHELVALNVGDVTNARGKPRVRIVLKVYKGCRSRRRTRALQEVTLPDRLRHKLATYLKWKRRHDQSTAPDAPLFMSRQGRLSPRRVRQIFTAYRKLAELSDELTFHALRHTFCQVLYEKHDDPFIVQRAARHADLETTTGYAQPSIDRLQRAVQHLPC